MTSAHPGPPRKFRDSFSMFASRVVSDLLQIPYIVGSAAHDHDLCHFGRVTREPEHDPRSAATFYHETRFFLRVGEVRLKYDRDLCQHAPSCIAYVVDMSLRKILPDDMPCGNVSETYSKTNVTSASEKTIGCLGVNFQGGIRDVLLPSQVSSTSLSSYI